MLLLSLVNLWSRTSSRCGGLLETLKCSHDIYAWKVWVLQSLEYFKTERSLKPSGEEPRLEYGTGTQRAAGWWMMIRGSINGSDTRKGISRLPWHWHQGEGLGRILKLHIPLFHCLDNLHKMSCRIHNVKSIRAPGPRRLPQVVSCSVWFIKDLQWNTEQSRDPFCSKLNFASTTFKRGCYKITYGQKYVDTPSH